MFTVAYYNKKCLDPKNPPLISDKKTDKPLSMFFYDSLIKINYLKNN